MRPACSCCSGAEFLAMILVVVYVGAVAVLFLFVVMMLDVDFAELRQGFLQYLPVGALVGVDPAGRADAGRRRLGDRRRRAAGDRRRRSRPTISNTEALGRVLYT
ncbi:MAG: NADH-quinone oxidoreductase subunit J [Piscinibacter sp.]